MDPLPLRARFRKKLAIAFCLSLFAYSNSAHAQLQTLESLQKTTATVEDIPPTVLKIYPAVEPTPALKYRFWPDRFELTDGNAFVSFHRATSIMFELGNRQRPVKVTPQQRDEWSQMPLEELPRDEVRDYLKYHDNVLKEMHRAAMMREGEYDLGLENLRGSETVELLLPEVQAARELARLLVLEIRLAMAEGRIDDAIKSLAVGFRLAGTTGNAADLLITRLVGVAITGIMLNQVETLIQLEQCPNLYWALASLPPSLSEMTRAVQFEASILARVFPQLAQLPSEDVEPSVWQKRLVSSLEEMFLYSQSLTEANATNAQLLAGLTLIVFDQPSRQQLIESGMNEEVVQQMTAAEAVVRATSQSVERVQDDFFKWSLLPEPLRSQTLDRSERVFERKEGIFPFDNLASALAGLLLPATQAANAAGKRTEQQIARLTTIEALRAYAAEHGEFPESLDQLTDLPAWTDAIANGPFSYERLSPTEARLESAPRWPGDNEYRTILELQKR